MTVDDLINRARLASGMRNLPGGNSYFEEALRLFEQAAAMATQGGDVKRAGEILTEAGYCCLNWSNWPEAIRRFDRAIATDAQNADAWDGKGDALFQSRRLQEALAACEQALRIDPQHRMARIHVENLRGMLKNR